MDSTTRTLSLTTVLLLVSAGASLGTGASTDPTGDHVKLHFRISDPGGQKTVVVALEDTSDDLVLYGYVYRNALYFSDGSSGGTDRTPVKVGPFIGGDWYRLDIVLDGTHYDVEVDQGGATTLRTFVTATEAGVRDDTSGIFPGIPGEPIFVERLRVDGDGGLVENTFTSALPGRGWSTTVTSGSISVEPSRPGHQSLGYAQVSSGLMPGLAYLHAPLAGHGGTYVAEASAGTPGILEPLLPQAVLAGISGALTAPTVEWSVVADHADGAPQKTTFFFVADGARTQLHPGWTSGEYHAVRASVNETAGSVVVRVDDGADLTFSGLTLGASAWVAAGDVSPGPGLGALRFDDLALYEEVSS